MSPIPRFLCGVFEYITKDESNAGGGGERVLWTAIAASQRTNPHVVNVVYTGDTEASKEQIIGKAKVRTLGVDIPQHFF